MCGACSAVPSGRRFTAGPPIAARPSAARAGRSAHSSWSAARSWSAFFWSCSISRRRPRCRRPATKPSVSRPSATRSGDRTRFSRSRARGSIHRRGSRLPRSDSAWSEPPRSGSSRQWRSPPSADESVMTGVGGERAPTSASEGRVTTTISHARLRVVFAFFAVASLVLSARLAYWQTVARSELLGQAMEQVRSDLVLAARRGVIRDRGGAILATTVELRSLYAIPGRITDRGAAAAALAPILGERPDVLRAALDSRAEWLYLKRRLPEETANRIAALRIQGLGFEKEPKRLYPNGAIGAQVL